MTLRHPPELVAVVVDVRQHDLPGVLVDVERPPLVEVAGALLERRVDDPDPVELIAKVLRVDV